jgi:phage-related protein
MKSAWDNIKTAIHAVSDFIKGTINVLKTVFASFGQAGNILKNALTVAWNGIKAVIGVVKGFISGAINSIKGFFNALKATGESLRGGMSAAWNGMKAVISSVAGSIRGIVNGIRNVLNNLRNINLRGAGQAIMNGFLNGLKSVWGKITSFVGSIAGWIKSHKGPISYDKRLLIPAGSAIMRGLDRGLMEDFKTVQKNVSGMASDISNTMRSDLNLDNLKLSRSINTDVFMATKLENLPRNPISSSVSANIILNLGNDSYRAFVEDITHAQNQKIDLELLYG